MKQPYRLSEKAFRRYEPVIQSILNEWPGPVKVLPENYNLSPATVEARLRDAIQSLIENDWVCGFIVPTQTLQSIVVRRLSDGSIIAGSREATKQAQEIVIQPAGPKPTMVLDFISDKVLIDAAALLLYYRKLVGPIMICNAPENFDYVNIERTTVIDNHDGTHFLL